MIKLWEKNCQYCSWRAVSVSLCGELNYQQKSPFLASDTSHLLAFSDYSPLFQTHLAFAGSIIVFFVNSGWTVDSWLLCFSLEIYCIDFALDWKTAAVCDFALVDPVLLLFYFFVDKKELLSKTSGKTRKRCGGERHHG